PAPSRRRVLMGAAGIAALFALGALPVSRVLANAGTQLGGVTRQAKKLVERATIPPADPSIDGLPGITTRITPSEEHYTVDTTLPQDHGYPVRVLVPNIYGMKNVKWLQQIKVETFDFKGYWQEQGWDDGAIVNTNTRIDVPGRNVRWNGSDVVIAGIAFAGARGIKQVELSFDEGKTWQAATLEPPPGAIAWTRWALRW